MDLAVRRVRVPSPKIVSNTDGARVSYPPNYVRCSWGEGLVSPQCLAFSHRVGPVPRCRCMGSVPAD